MPVTVSVPAGALLAEQLPVPEDNVAVQSEVEPVVNATVPVAVAEEVLTEAEKLTLWPSLTELGATDTDVEVGVRAGCTVSESGGEVDEANVSSPEYLAAIVWVLATE